MKQFAGIAALFTLSVAMFAGGLSQAQGVNPDFIQNDFQSHEILSNHNSELSANVFVQKNGDTVAEEHNVLMDGQQAIVELLTSPSPSQYETISVGNGTSFPTNSDTELPGRITNCGFSPIDASNSDDGTVNVATDGQSYTVSVTYTSGCSIEINQTALEIGSGNYVNEEINTFAGTDFGRTIPFEPNDQLTVEWEIIPQNP